MEEYLDNSEIYADVRERNQAVWELLVYAHLIFCRVYVFKNYQAFARSFKVMGEKPEEYWEGLSRERLIDEIRICTAFENYNKAVLLSKGYVVHSIDPKKNKELAKLQREQPVEISTFLKTNRFLKKDCRGLYLEGLQESRTIPFSRTLSDSYQAIIELDARFLGFLTNLNKKRNELHFYKNYPGAFRVETFLESLEFAKNYGTGLLRVEIEKAELHTD